MESRLSEYRAMAALARAEGRIESAKSWDGLAYAAQISLCRFEAEQEMQVLDQAVDPDGLDQLGQHLWNEVEALERLDMFLDGDREVEDEI